MTELRRLRIATGMGVSDFAVHVGVKESTVRDWERGRCVPCERNARRLARVLSDMLGRKVTWEEVRGGA